MNTSLERTNDETPPGHWKGVDPIPLIHIFASKAITREKRKTPQDLIV